MGTAHLHLTLFQALMLGLDRMLLGRSTVGHGNLDTGGRKHTLIDVLPRYGAWDELKAQIRQSWRFRFDWFFKSRTPQVHIFTEAWLLPRVTHHPVAVTTGYLHIFALAC